MKMLIAALVALVVIVLFQAWRHDCDWRGVGRVEKMISCVVGGR